MSSQNLAFLFAAVYVAPVLPRWYGGVIGLVYVIAGIYLGVKE